MAKHDKTDDGLNTFMEMRETRLRESAQAASAATGLSFNACSELLLLGWQLHMSMDNVTTWTHPSAQYTIK